MNKKKIENGFVHSQSNRSFYFAHRELLSPITVFIRRCVCARGKKKAEKERLKELKSLVM